MFTTLKVSVIMALTVSIGVTILYYLPKVITIRGINKADISSNNLVDLNLALRTQKGSASEAIDVDTITILQFHLQIHRNK